MKTLNTTKSGPVLIINYEYPPLGAGAANASYNLALQLIDKADSVSVLTAGIGNNTGPRVENGVNVFRIKAPRKRVDRSNLFEMAAFVLLAFPVMFKIIIRRKITCTIVFFSLPCGPLGLIAKWFLKVPYIISLRGGDVPGNESGLETVHFLLTPVRRLVLRLSKYIVAPSAGLKELAESRDPFNVKVIPNGVDCTFFKPCESKTCSQSNILFVGRLQEQKNLFELIQAFSLISIKQDCYLHFVGNGPSQRELKESAEEIGVLSKVVFHGWRVKTELRDLYRNGTCLVNPSHCEGMPNSVLEAMACGLAVVASDVPGNRDVIKDGYTGLLYKKGNVELLASKLEMIFTDKMLADSLGANARSYVQEHYSWNATARMYRDLF